MPEKRTRTDKSYTEMVTCTEAGREVGTSQSHSRHKKEHLTNIDLMDLEEEAIVYFVKDHKKLYKANEHCKGKARNECFWERFANSLDLSVKVFKTWID